ncbi:isoquinoline 1-oxidoreductase subunit alpha [Polymorphobacter glacialis]|uniref:Isoquinoline 1-oxidoreductase subunit alpha n=1 Tax=Sandarakinorhabdus glacialis TaxID=1614636 RepID=A0A917E8Y3_9SPHN|nr:(2Fe-2S)-binding protein [Polymorphobacter glacialis]GGE12363.1 isoquinoline 1-oxidoreductase subunit alpha [Polymorphobacter glacialis]
MTRLNINGKTINVTADPEMPLLWVLRDVVGMTGTKFGCGAALCGACTVHLDGAPVRSCQTPLSAVGTAAVTTIEGLSASPIGRKLQDAWVTLDVPQCGYCQAGQLMSAAALLKETPKPTDADIDAAMNGNLCRCATYIRIRAAIKQAAGVTA